MKKNRFMELSKLSSNLQLMLEDKREKIVAFVTDNDEFSVLPIINDLANIYKQNKKVLVLSYKPITERLENVTYMTLDDKVNNFDEILTTCDAYNIVLLNCPNMIDYRSYLHAARFMKETVIVAKEKKSKTENLKKMISILQNEKMDLLGVIYQK